MISQTLCRVSEREGWFGGRCKHFGDASKFKTVELANLAQDDSEGLQRVASVLAGIVGCQPEEVSQEIRHKVSVFCLYNVFL